MFPSQKMWIQDVTEAYIQGDHIQWDAYVKPAEELNLKEVMYCKHLTPYYGLFESGDSWLQQ